jgi:hypothetical protein
VYTKWPTFGARSCAQNGSGLKDYIYPYPSVTSLPQQKKRKKKRSRKEKRPNIDGSRKETCPDSVDDSANQTECPKCRHSITKRIRMLAISARRTAFRALAL